MNKYNNKNYNIFKIQYKKILQKAVRVPFYFFRYTVVILLSSMIFTNTQLIVITSY